MRHIQRVLATLPTMKRLLLALVCLVMADGVITRHLVQENLAREGNPLLEPLVGENIFLLVKALGALVCAVILWDIYRRWARLAVVGTSFLVVVYAGIVIWNLSIYLTS